VTRAATSLSGTPASPYTFQFWIHAPKGIIEPNSWLIRFELDYNYGVPKTFVTADFDGEGPADLAIIFDNAQGDSSTIGVARNYTNENNPSQTGLVRF